MAAEILNDLEQRLFVPLKDRFVEHPLDDSSVYKILERINKAGIRARDYRSLIFETYVKHTIDGFREDRPGTFVPLKTDYSGKGGEYEYSVGPLGNVIIREGKIVVGEIDGVYMDETTSTMILLEATVRKGAKINYVGKNNFARQIWGNYSIILKVRPQNGDAPRVQILPERGTAKIITPSIENVSFPPNQPRPKRQSFAGRAREERYYNDDYSTYQQFLKLIEKN